MRAVDYVTNGFGGVIDDLLRGPSPTIGVGFTKQQVALRGPRETPRAFAPPAPSDYAIRQAFLDQQLVDPIASAGLQTYKSRGIGGIDQTISFFAALNDAFQAYANSGVWPATVNRLGFQKAVLDVFVKSFNTAASRVGSNPLISSFREAITKQIQQNAENAKLVFYSLPFIYQSLEQVRSRLAR